MKIFGSKKINCNKHKISSVTHLCTDNKCNNNPMLCIQCFIETINRNYHSDHQKSIVPFEQAVESISSRIQDQVYAMERVYKSTVGRSQFVGLLMQVQKGEILYKQLDNRINSIKGQIQIEMDLLLKQFQKQIFIEKIQFFNVLDSYQKSYIKNIDYLRNRSETIINFNNSLKYYSNKNNLHLKLISQGHKKTDWLIKTKKILQDSQKYYQNGIYANQISNLYSLVNRVKIDIWPVWKGQQNGSEKSQNIRLFIRKIFNQLVYIPEVKSLQEQNQKSSNIFLLGGGIGANRSHSVKQDIQRKYRLFTT